MGLGGLVWMDVGGLRSVGLGAVPLRALVQPCGLWMAVVSRRNRGAALLVAGSGGVLRIWRRVRVWIRIRQRRLGCAGALRGFPSLVGPRVLRRGVRRPGERDQRQHI